MSTILCNLRVFVIIFGVLRQQIRKSLQYLIPNIINIYMFDLLNETFDSFQEMCDISMDVSFSGVFTLIHVISECINSRKSIIATYL